MKPPYFKTTKEQWALLAPGYLISSYGRVYSLGRRRLLKPRRNSSGYYRIHIPNGNKLKDIFIHIKVIELFGDRNGTRIPDGSIGLFEHHLSIDHVDRCKEHNGVANLELVTHRENCLRKYKKKEKLA